MQTRILMTCSAVLMAAAGVGLTFLPQELLEAGGWASSPGGVVAAQILGALYLGFAMMNWAARGNLLGGIYSRPIVLANFSYSTVAAFAIARALLVGLPAAIALAVHVVLAGWFGLVLFSGTPVPRSAPR